MSKTRQLFEYDLAFKKIVGGCDEAGRGPLAGPLVCAAVKMPLDYMIDGIDDSKKLSEAKRESLFEQIINKAVSYKVFVIDNNVIDKINILNATKQGMKEAVNQLESTELMLIDAVKTDFDRKYMPIIKGDALSYNIAAASIVAKVTRDRLMREMDRLYPQYNFRQNKGYGTREHINAIRQNGASEIHRKTYLTKLTAEEVSDD